MTFHIRQLSQAGALLRRVGLEALPQLNEARIKLVLSILALVRLDPILGNKVVATQQRPSTRYSSIGCYYCMTCTSLPSPLSRLPFPALVHKESPIF